VVEQRYARATSLFTTAVDSNRLPLAEPHPSWALGHLDVAVRSLTRPYLIRSRLGESATGARRQGKTRRGRRRASSSAIVRPCQILSLLRSLLGAPGAPTSCMRAHGACRRRHDRDRCVYRIFDSAWTQRTDGVSSRPDEGSVQADSRLTGLIASELSPSELARSNKVNIDVRILRPSR
jgi:hypothetical protein